MPSGDSHTLSGEQQSSRRALDKRHQDLEALADEAWAGRYQSAHAFKVRVLQRAHALALLRLQEEWDRRRFSAGDAEEPSAARPQAATIHSLGSDVLAMLLSRVTGAAGPKQISFATSSKSRRCLAQICRLFEALVCDGCEATRHTLAQPPGKLPASAPTGFFTRELERATFSSRLSSIVLSLPTLGQDGHVDVDTAAAALPICAALTHVAIIVTTASNGVLSIPAALLDALTRCPKLSALCLESPTGEIEEVSPKCIDQLSNALPRLTQLTRLRASLCDFSASNTFLPALEQMPALLELIFQNAYASDGWVRLFTVSSLTRLELLDCEYWGPASARGEDALYPSSSLKELHWSSSCQPEAADMLALAHALPQLTQLSKLVVIGVSICDVEDADARATFAAALPSMRSLRTLWLDNSMCVEVFSQLPQSRQLMDLRIDYCIDGRDDDASSVATFVAACPGLRRLELEVEEEEDCDASVVLNGVFSTLAGSGSLQHLVLRGNCNLRLLCALGMELPRYRALESVTLANVRVLKDDALTESVITTLAARAPQVSFQIRP